MPLCQDIFFLPILPQEKKASAYRLLSFSPCLSEHGHASPNLLLLISQELHARSLAATRSDSRSFALCEKILHLPVDLSRRSPFSLFTLPVLAPTIRFSHFQVSPSIWERAR